MMLNCLESWEGVVRWEARHGVVASRVCQVSAGNRGKIQLMSIICKVKSTYFLL
jgi:hypothetical protein